MTSPPGLALLLLTAASSAAALTMPTTMPVRASGYVDLLGVVPTEDSQRQRPQGIAVLRLDADVATWLEGRLELRGRAGGPFEGGHPGMFNFVHTFQNYSPVLEFREAYATARFEKIDLRIGIQQFSWGKLDGIPPTDVLNPRDLHDPFVTDFEEAKIGIPAVHALYHLNDQPGFSLGQMRASLVYVPIAVPSRLPLLEERWFPPAALPPRRIVRTSFQVEKSLDEAVFRLCQRKPFKGSANPACINNGVSSPMNDLTIMPVLRTGNDRAAYALDSGGIGMRLQGTWRDTDWDLYHYTGPETGPEAGTVTGLLTTDTGLPVNTQPTIPVELELSSPHDVGAAK